MPDWEFIGELNGIQAAFRDAALSDAACCIAIADGRIAAVGFGTPILDRHATDAVVDTSLPGPVQQQLLELFERAGTALMRIPRCGVVADKWLQWIQQNDSSAVIRWAAFLTTGPRLFYVESFHDGAVLRIQNVTRMCASEMNGLIANVLEDSKPD